MLKKSSLSFPLFNLNYCFEFNNSYPCFESKSLQLQCSKLASFTIANSVLPIILQNTSPLLDNILFNMFSIVSLNDYCFLILHKRLFNLHSPLSYNHFKRFFPFHELKSLKYFTNPYMISPNFENTLLQNSFPNFLLLFLDSFNESSKVHLELCINN